MTRRTSGTIFIFISAFLHATRYFCAAIYGSNVVSWNEVIFDSLLASIGTKLVFAGNLCLIIGVLYLIWAELEGVIQWIIKKIKKSI